MTAVRKVAEELGLRRALKCVIVTMAHGPRAALSHRPLQCRLLCRPPQTTMTTTMMTAAVAAALLVVEAETAVGSGGRGGAVSLSAAALVDSALPKLWSNCVGVELERQ